MNNTTISGKINTMKAYYLSLKDDTPCSGYYDHTFIDDLLSDIELVKQEVRQLPKDDTAVVVIPARSHGDVIDEINQQLSNIDKLVLILSGDEERVFDQTKIEHPNIKIWLQNAHPNKDDLYDRIGTGYAPHDLKDTKYEKNIDLFFSGQITHKRRREMKQAIGDVPDNWLVNYTEGFTQGFSPERYFDYMAQAKIVPAPSGAVIPDSFRVFEALQTMAIPIADEVNPSGTIESYWEWLFEEVVRFPLIKDWRSLKGYVNDILPNYTELAQIQTEWWLRYKRKLKNKLKKQLGIKPKDITAIICTSPIPSHPSTDIIDETIQSIRHHLPDIDIIIQVDGLRKEQEHMRGQYNGYKSQLLWDCLHKYTNVYPVLFNEHKHQVGMMRESMEYIDTPQLLYVEHDAPLVIDYDIPFTELTGYINEGKSDLIRFHFEAVIPESHHHMMLGMENNAPLMKTIQWSQRPQLASTEYYKNLLDLHFSKDANSFLEDVLHGVMYNGYNNYGMSFWNRNRLHIYHPEGNIKRSYHTDGRAGGAKFDDSQVF